MPLSVSFGALRAFVEVGRQGSIKRAARSLNVTAGAVSQHVRALEAHFGMPLLERGHRSVRLSAHGLRLFAELVPGFEQIDDAVQRLEDRRPRPRSLVVSTTPSFAACWLTPRLGGFVAQHPEIELRVETSIQLADMTCGRVDVAIRHGSGDYPGLNAALLFKPRLVAVASPLLLRHGPLSDPIDCLQYPLLQDRDRADWPTWFDAHGIKRGRNATRGPSYADDALLIQAAIAGQGLAIVRDVYATRPLESGSLMRALDKSAPSTARYYAVVSPNRMTAPKIIAFRQWIMREAGVA
ncbi:transcriptional regulator, LysR family [Methylorubrum populi BJ001]|jgi:LysR family glycine cleavage system transcriptional activator|uniref:Transcriptional regulator, LysR family n=1 Tax=Methylorubrum populi (strain ATCC BAA-705 / NCIMB 13946 / BJ001) TaxID=441620 RepID=B1ZJV5_METPB|nr:LysR substrate-binding domain-containing protein [Methylorubrum populi]ACB82869.1 transcriptional regulator, LysR family [Methylorubrum populi BJ001]OAH26803.1 LysR family transcriptional regulator [Methylorubrum populi]PZP68908.1 MAG: LysR family transcriptional regulator [Methylorubrum populi]